jgi:hypothetical protein
VAQADDRARPPKTAAEELVARAQQSYQAGHLNEALALYRQVTTQHARSKSFGVAQYNVAFILAKLGKPEAAIAEYNLLLAGNVNDRDPGEHILQAYRNYRNRAAKALSQLYEGMGKADEALRWALLARDEYPYCTWCGTCAWEEAAASSANIIRLLFAAGEIDEAVAYMHCLVAEGDEYYAGTARALVGFYYEFGQLHELAEQLELTRQQNLIAYERLLAEERKEHPEREPAVDRNYDGRSPAMRVASEYIELLWWAEEPISRPAAPAEADMRTDAKAASPGGETGHLPAGLPPPPRWRALMALSVGFVALLLLLVAFTRWAPAGI